MRTLLQDLRHALRVFARSPVFTAAAVLSLALGIGANTAIFSVVHAVLLNKLPYRDPTRLVMVWESPVNCRDCSSTVAVGTYLDWRAANPSFEGIAALHETFEVNLTGAHKPERLDTQLVTPSFFTVLGVQPLLGRTFLPDELGPDAPRLTVLSHKFWVRRFVADPRCHRQVHRDREPGPHHHRRDAARVLLPESERRIVADVPVESPVHPGRRTLHA